MTETKVRLPFPSAHARQSDIVGILRRQRETPAGQKTAPIALILHGVLSHKDQLYHRRLAHLLPLDSFRFDFRANAESPGEWGMGDFEKDLADLHVVVKHLRDEYGYRVESIIGHSRGALVGWLYHSDVERRRRGLVENTEGYVLDKIPHWVALSGRWRMHRIHDRDSVYEASFAEKGYYAWDAKVAGQKVSVQVRRHDVDKFATFPIEQRVADFPNGTDCLLIHGVADTTVPAADAGFYLNKLNSVSRRTGSTQLVLIDDADHNFRRHYDEVVDVILRWLADRKWAAGGGKVAQGKL